MFDTNRDGFPDLLASGPIANGLGAVFIFKGSTSGISSNYTSNSNASNTIYGEGSVTNFGLSLY